jgi:DNA repair protein RecO (recombination protein O)
MLLTSDRCICLRKFEYSETSQILTLFCKDHGIVRLMAKGAHRRTKAGSSKFDGGIDLLDTGDAVFADNPSHDLTTLTEWKLSDGHLDLRKNLRGLYLGLYAAELVSAVIEEHDPHPELFDSLANLLPMLATNHREENFLAFEMDLLHDSGFLPQLTACVSCAQTADDRAALYFSPSRGGLICRDCQSTTPDHMPLDPRLLRLLQNLSTTAASGTNRRLPMLSRHQTDPLNEILAAHIEQNLSRPLRMRPYVLPRAANRRPARPGPAGAPSI